MVMVKVQGTVENDVNWNRIGGTYHLTLDQTVS